MKEKNAQKNQMAMWVLITIVLMGVSFFAGSKHGESAAKNAAMQMRGQYASGGAGGTRSRFAGGGAVVGEVTSKDDTSITVKSRDGSSKIVLYTGTTDVMTTAEGAMSDIDVGSQVMIQGTQNSDGSVTAKSIQIRPDMPADSVTAPATAPATSTN